MPDPHRGRRKPCERPTLSVEQVQALAMLVPPRFSAFILVTTYGCLRWGEVTALTRRDVDVEAGTVNVRAAFVERSNGALELGPPKSRASVRRIALPLPVVAMLRAHLDIYVHGDPTALVFTGPSGRPLRRSNFNKQVAWAQARATLGVPQLHLHDLRHTGNTLAAGTPGTSTRDLMERMGHDTMRAALIYQHSTRDAGRRIADALQSEIERGESSANRQDVAWTESRARRATARKLGLTPRGPGIAGPFPGAGDGNRTRTVSLGISRPAHRSPGFSGISARQRACALPLSSIVRCGNGHATGTRLGLSITPAPAPKAGNG